jgi:nucleotide-binding universal stress UspA family protein
MYRTILLAVDGSDDSMEAARQAVDLAARYGAELDACYVIETRTAYDNAIVEPELVRRNLRDEGEATLETIEAAAKGVAVTRAIEEGVPAETILAYSDAHEIDLLVVGATGKSAFKTVLLGSTTEALVQSGWPVLVVGDQGG